jgi:hypothetical protein
MKGRQVGLGFAWLGLALVAFAAVQGLGQTNEGFRNVRGYLCRNDDSKEPPSPENAYGQMGLMVGKRPVFFWVVQFGMPIEGTYYYRHAKPKTDRLGSEYIVKYKIVQGHKRARTITATGRFKPVRPCAMQ